MNMSISRSESQLYFESLFTQDGCKPFQNVSKKNILETQLTLTQADELKHRLKREIGPYYYKSLLSYMESIASINKNLFSWATVKLYYSVFYSIRAYLACQDIAILRERRNLFYVKVKQNEFIKKCDDNTDHKGTILTLCGLYQNIDRLLSNNIGGINAYQWMMKKRGEVNYKDMEFHDPNAPVFWEKIKDEINKTNIKKLIENIVKDEDWIYCFQDEYAMLGVPTKRIILTVEEMKKQSVEINILDSKIKLINNLSKKLLGNSIDPLLVWKFN